MKSQIFLLFAAVALACGGTTVLDPGGTGGTDDQDSGAPGGSGGGGGTGGSPGGMGGTAGTGVAGTDPGGMGGGTSGTGPGGSGGSITCPGLPSCNWCNGTNIYDESGCVIGYMCANGEDPCVTQPCDASDPMSCPSGMTCKQDMLCWWGSPCGEKECSVTPISGCDCDWSCPDGNDYGFRCVPTGSGSESCECLINGEVVYGCADTPGSAGGPADWCGSSCCDLPG
jgi:hypothetical protein